MGKYIIWSTSIDYIATNLHNSTNRVYDVYFMKDIVYTP